MQGGILTDQQDNSHLYRAEADNNLFEVTDGVTAICKTIGQTYQINIHHIVNIYAQPRSALGRTVGVHLVMASPPHIVFQFEGSDREVADKTVDFLDRVVRVWTTALHQANRR